MFGNRVIGADAETIDVFLLLLAIVLFVWRSKILNYKLYNLLLLPLIFCLIFGFLIGAYKLEGGRNFINFIGSGFGGFFIAYYPQKLIMLFVDRIKKKNGTGL